ncbi:putative Cell wall assembly/cell proliferation coordinating protein, KNR4 [Tenacibaculum amylolyticum]
MKKQNLKTITLSVLAIFFTGVIYLDVKNEITSRAIKNRIIRKKRMVEKAKHDIKDIKSMYGEEQTVMDLIIALTDDHSLHKNIGPKLLKSDIENIEGNLQVTFPSSYKLFLQYFGDGGEHIYGTPIHSSKKLVLLSDHQKDLGSTVQFENGTTVPTKDLLCLVTNDKNGGAWCWLMNENTDTGEWPLVYFNSKEQKLQYKVDNFTEWLKILVAHKTVEVTQETKANYPTIG